MYARVARFEGLNVAAVEATMSEADELIRPMVEPLAGYGGHLELVASNGDGLSITFFDSEENAEAAEQIFDQEMPQKLGQLFASWEGRRASVGRYKVLSEERR